MVEVCVLQCTVTGDKGKIVEELFELKKIKYLMRAEKIIRN